MYFTKIFSLYFMLFPLYIALEFKWEYLIWNGQPLLVEPGHKKAVDFRQVYQMLEPGRYYLDVCQECHLSALYHFRLDIVNSQKDRNVLHNGIYNVSKTCLNACPLAMLLPQNQSLDTLEMEVFADSSTRVELYMRVLRQLDYWNETEFLDDEETWPRDTKNFILGAFQRMRKYFQSQEFLDAMKSSDKLNKSLSQKFSQTWMDLALNIQNAMQQKHMVILYNHEKNHICPDIGENPVFACGNCNDSAGPCTFYFDQRLFSRTPSTGFMASILAHEYIHGFGYDCNVGYAIGEIVQSSITEKG